MLRRVMPTAVAAALAVPTLALAQTSTVQIYGTAYMEYGFIDQGTRGTGAPGTVGAGGPGTGELNNIDLLQRPGSNIGFKGEEKLGGGLSAWFQCESTADWRGQDQEGWCGRNSALGLKGGFGNVFVGRWDSPFKRTAGPAIVGANVAGAFGVGYTVFGGVGSNIGAAGRTSFWRRQANMINYDSPRFGGFQVLAGFSTAQAAGTATTTGATNAKPRVLSLGAQYRAGPLYIGAAYERHDEFGGSGAPAATGGDTSDKGWLIGAAYTWGPVRFGALYTRQTLEPTTTTESKVDAWTAGVDWRIVGPHGLRAAYTQVDDVKGNSTAVLTGSGAGLRPAALIGGARGNTGAKLWQVRYVYAFSKRTEFNFGYVKLDNDSQGFYRLGGLNEPVTGGNSQDGWVTALRHRF